MGSVKQDDQIAKLRRVIEITPSGHPERAMAALKLGAALRNLFNQSADMQDLDESITYYREGVDLLPGTNADRWLWQMNFGAALRTRFNRTGQQPDLDEIIQRLRYAINNCPGNLDGQTRSLLFNNLGRSLRSRFDITGYNEALDESIEMFQKALSFRPFGDQNRSTSLSDLANSLRTRFEARGEIVDLSNAIEYQYEALRARPCDHPDRWLVLSNLGNTLMARFKHAGDIQDLNIATTHLREAVNSSEIGHRSRSNAIVNLASNLRTRFEHLHKLDDLEEAIQLNQQALELYSPFDPSRSTPLDNWANCLSSRFAAFGKIEDLDSAIAKNREALILRPTGPARALTLNNIAISLSTRYQVTGNEEDLDSAIGSHVDCLTLRPTGHPDRWMTLSHLGTAKASKFFRSGDSRDLDDAVNFHREALAVCPQNPSMRAMVLGNLASTLTDAYDHNSLPIHIEEAITKHKEALSLYPLNHSHRSNALFNVAMVCGKRYNIYRGLDDLKEVVERYSEVEKLLPNAHPLLCRVRSNLAMAYLCQDHSDASVSRVISLYENAVNQTTASPQDRFDAALSWADSARKLDHESITTAYRQAVNLLDRCLMTNPTAELQHKLLVRLPKSFASDAAASAIQAGEIETAVELLEQGRGLLWARMNYYRYPLDALERVNSSLAERFKAVSKRLENLAMSPSVGTSTGLDPRAVLSLDKQLQDLHTFSKEWDEVVEQIRMLDEFQDFMRAVPFVKLQKAAANGPIIIVNISERRSDAIILCDGRPPEVVPLLEATPAHLTELSTKLSCSLENLHSEDQRNVVFPGLDVIRRLPLLDRFGDDSRNAKRWRGYIRQALQTLWQSVASPVVERLQGLSVPLQSRIWWCPTTSLCRLPLHAAGPYRKGKQNLPDMYISSYILTLRSSDALKSSTRSIAGGGLIQLKLLVIGCSGNPGKPGFLRNVNREVSTVKKVMTSSPLKTPTVTELMGEQANRNSVLDGLHRHSWAHFTCHGFQNPQPFRSSFELHNRQKLTLLDLMQAQIPNAEFAFLSACNTATGDIEGTPDEGLHLAATMQFSGFRSVVGTLWPMNDKDGPNIVQEFYRYLLDEGKGDYRHSAVALHHAVKSMREQHVPLDRWINFVHFGA